MRTSLMQAIADKDLSRAGRLVADGVETFEVERVSREDFTVRKGFGVVVSLVYRGESEESADGEMLDPDEPVAFDASTVEITPETVTFTSDGMLCVRIDSNTCVPVENFGDNEDDYAADRFFLTRKEAEGHVVEITRALCYAGLENY
jgi:hypothetical protein